MDSPCIKQTVCKVFKIFQCGKYLVAYVLKGIGYEILSVAMSPSVYHRHHIVEVLIISYLYVA